MFRIRNLIVAITMISIFYSCKKENIPQISDKLLVRTVAGGDSMVYSSYYYDSQDRLINIRDTTGQGHTGEISIAYNDDGYPLKFIIRSVYSDGTLGHVHEDSLVYENGNVVKQLMHSYFPPDPQWHHFQSRTYTYDAKNRRISDSLQSKINDTFQLVEYTNYSYGNDENVQQIEHHDLWTGVSQKWKLTPSYSSAPNPYNKLGKTLCYLDDITITPQYFLLSKNRLTEVFFENDWSNYRTTYSYEYNADGLVQKMITGYSFDPQPFTINFYYE